MNRNSENNWNIWRAAKATQSSDDLVYIDATEGRALFNILDYAAHDLSGANFAQNLVELMGRMVEASREPEL